jgi:beta-glucosidase
MNYPKDFLWGAATSSHQVEGNNINNDWWQWEQAGKARHCSGAATDHYNRYEEDFKMAADLGHNAHRFSIEWSRIEPRQGMFDPSAMAHYQKVLAALKARSITPIVTLHHFTNPIWFADIGGWMNVKAVEYYVNYVKEVAAALGREVRYWVTINEPMVYALYSYIEGLWPPGEHSQRMGFQVANTMIQAHRRAYGAIHELYHRHGWEAPLVGFAKCFRPFLVCPWTRGFFCRLGVLWRNAYFNRYFLNSVASSLDFIGVNYYELEYDSTDPKLPHGLFGGNCTHAHKHLDHMNQIGWGVFPQGLGIVFRWLARYRRPILITENGTCERDDIWRQRFIEEHIQEVDKAVERDMDIIGYCYWSLLDNFEWHYGSDIRFGLIDVNYETLGRKVRPSARRYQELIEERKK